MSSTVRVIAALCGHLGMPQVNYLLKEADAIAAETSDQLDVPLPRILCWFTRIMSAKESSVKDPYHLQRNRMQCSHTAETPQGGTNEEWGHTAKIIQLILKNIENQRRGLSILDVGCQDGYLLEQLAEHEELEEKIKHYTGVEISEELVKTGRGKFQSSRNCEFIHGNINHLSTWEDIPRNLNTVVYSAMTHFSSPTRIKRFLLLTRRRIENDPQARIYINYPIYNPDARSYQRYAPINEGGITAYENRTFGGYFLYSPDQFEKLVNLCGYQVHKKNSYAKREGQFDFDWDYLSLRKI